MDSTAECAEHYADLGWAVIPVHSVQDGVCTCRRGARCSHAGKHPRTKRGLKDGTTDLAKIRRWWSRWPDANVAICTGSPSDLVVIDVDPAHGGDRSLDDALARLGGLPDGPVARTGSGGRHLLFQHPGGRVPSRVGIADGLDVRADNGYIVAPTSGHVCGGTYQWLVDPEKLPPPTLPELWLEWLAGAPCYTRGHKRAQEGARGRKRSQDIVGGQGGDFFAGIALGEVVERAISATLPTGPGRRHRHLFEFARWLKGHPAIADAPVQALKPYVRQWHQRAKPIITSQAFEDSWWDFAEAWGKIKYPRGFAMADILERAAVADPPAAAAEYEQDKLKLLVCVCRELQREAGDGTFFLSGRTAGDLVGVSGQQAWRWLNGLTLDKILSRVSTGSRKARKASEYRYIAEGDK